MGRIHYLLLVLLYNNDRGIVEVELKYLADR